jgi:hypothetical protein
MRSPIIFLVEVNDIMGRFGKVRIERHDEAMLKLITGEPLLMEQLYQIGRLSSSQSGTLSLYGR